MVNNTDEKNKTRKTSLVCFIYLFRIRITNNNKKYVLIKKYPSATVVPGEAPKISGAEYINDTIKKSHSVWTFVWFEIKNFNIPHPTNIANPAPKPDKKSQR
ncbi:MAG: hypothetical protein HOB70_07330 [Chloroflexi bacterium]|nr:hypothetical protein [Chloroflexota bacterium]